MFIKNKLYTITEIMKIIPLSRVTIYKMLQERACPKINTNMGKRAYYLYQGEDLDSIFLKQ